MTSVNARPRPPVARRPARGLRLRSPWWLVAFIVTGWTFLALLLLAGMAVGR